MYMVLTWRTLGSASDSAVRTEIMNEIGQGGMLNAREVVPGHIVANVHKNGGSGDVFDLEERLRPVAANRYTFTLYYLPRGHVILHSDDLTDKPLQTIADF